MDVPIKGPCYSDDEDRGLEEMLQNHASPIIAYPPLADGRRERDAYSRCCHESSVAERQSDRILGKESRKRETQSVSIGLEASDVRSNGKQKHRYPE